MVEVASVLLVIGISLLITRIATVALTLTGLSREASKFQARSAFTGVGYTTTESENIVNHPVRRRIVMALMFMGNAGVISVISLMIVTIVQSNSTLDIGFRILVLALGLIGFWAISNSGWLNRKLTEWIEWALTRWTTLNVRDYARLLGVSDGYEITEISVTEESWLADKSLDELNLSAEGVLVLGISKPDGSYVGTPSHETILREGCKIVAYGPADRLIEIPERKAGESGNKFHEDSVQKFRTGSDSS